MQVGALPAAGMLVSKQVQASHHGMIELLSVCLARADEDDDFSEGDVEERRFLKKARGR